MNCCSYASIPHGHPSHTPCLHETVSTPLRSSTNGDYGKGCCYTKYCPFHLKSHQKVILYANYYQNTSMWYIILFLFSGSIHCWWEKYIVPFKNQRLLILSKTKSIIDNFSTTCYLPMILHYSAKTAFRYPEPFRSYGGGHSWWDTLYSVLRPLFFEQHKRLHVLNYWI